MKNLNRRQSSSCCRESSMKSLWSLWRLPYLSATTWPIVASTPLRDNWPYLSETIRPMVAAIPLRDNQPYRSEITWPMVV